MEYRDQLRPASFRGVPFFVEQADHSGGRRIHVHEFPKRDRPFNEDLGRAIRKFTLGGFVLEPDYLSKRNRLQTALEAEGAGTLVHPFLGSIEVKVQSFSVSEGKDMGGVATFSMSFIEDGEINFPTNLNNTQAVVTERATHARARVEQNFIRDFNPASEGALQSLREGLHVIGDARRGT